MENKENKKIAKLLCKAIDLRKEGDKKITYLKNNIKNIKAYGRADLSLMAAMKYSEAAKTFHKINDENEAECWALAAENWVKATELFKYPEWFFECGLAFEKIKEYKEAAKYYHKAASSATKIHYIFKKAMYLEKALGALLLLQENNRR